MRRPRPRRLPGKRGGAPRSRGPRRQQGPVRGQHVRPRGRGPAGRGGRVEATAGGLIKSLTLLLLYCVNIDI